MKRVEWDEDKNKQLQTERDISFEALKEGLPYQSLLSSIIHKYLTGQLDDRR